VIRLLKIDKMMQFLMMSLVTALPNGAPRCQINVEGIARGMNAPDDQLGYSLIVDRSGPGIWNIRVNHPTRPDYQGILLYVTPPGEDTTHLGSFEFRNATKWKFQPQSLCTSNNVKQNERGTVTHANPDRVAIARNVNFTWTSEGASGPFVAQAVVASQDGPGLPRWHKVANVQFGAATDITSYPPTATDQYFTQTHTGIPTSIPTFNSAVAKGFTGLLSLLVFL
jgi:hypothetical protein